jgi:hypothetical protein
VNVSKCGALGRKALNGTGIAHATRPTVVLPITVDLEAAANLTTDEEAGLISTNAQELTGDWRSYSHRSAASGPGPSSPHSGDELSRLGKHQALVSFAATVPDYKILAAFVERLKGTSSCLRYSYHDERGKVQMIELASEAGYAAPG